MKLPLFSLLLLVSCGQSAPTSETKIVGGTVVSSIDDITMRSTVALIGNGSMCTGTLIGPNHVLTAAHCLTSPAGIKIASGTKPVAVPGLRVIGAVKHPKWTRGPYDVGIVVFEGTLPANLVPVSISPMQGIENGVSTILAGYGVTRENSSDSGTLRKVKAKIKRFLTTAKEFEMQEGMGVGSCYGDSGGPAYIENSGVLTVIGATSRGSNCDTGDGIYGDVRLFQGWYKCTAKALGKPLRSLLNDASNVHCKPGTEDTDVATSPDIPQLAGRDVKVMIGDAGPSLDSHTLLLSATLDTAGQRKVSYCIGDLKTCGTNSGVWIEATRQKTVGGRVIFSTAQPISLTADLKMSFKSEAGAGSAQMQMVAFRKL